MTETETTMEKTWRSYQQTAFQALCRRSQLFETFWWTQNQAFTNKWFKRSTKTFTIQENDKKINTKPSANEQNISFFCVLFRRPTLISMWIWMHHPRYLLRGLQCTKGMVVSWRKEVLLGFPVLPSTVSSSEHLRKKKRIMYSWTKYIGLLESFHGFEKILFI